MSDSMRHPQSPANGIQGVHDATDMESPPSPAPIPFSERFASMDVLRGFALLGILPINILALALPAIADQNPNLAGGFTGINFASWLVCYVFFDHKMMTIFSMLFGAGLVLMSDRMTQRGASPAAFFYRRAAILLVIGLAHAYLFWEGDILRSYALCGMIVYPLRKQRPRTLIILGLLAMLPSVWLARNDAAHLAEARDAANRVEGAEKDGQTPSDADLLLAEDWGGSHTAAEIEEESRTYRQGSYWQLARNRAANMFSIESMIFVREFISIINGRMLLGMALMTLGVFSAQLSLRFYVFLAVLGYGLGLPIVGWGAYQLVENGFDLVYMLGGGAEFNEFGSLLVALGHIGTVVSIYKTGLVIWLTSRLAAVGRMALSNYLMQSVICTTLFYGYGFGWFGSLDRVQLLGVVFVIWALQLWYSPVWLKHFRFGPVEWLWRSLTYGKAQPMLNL
jgi:uncharacterized protein